jgi:hypothetical protein
VKTLVLMICLVLALSSGAQETMPPDVQQSVSRALAYLSRQQQPDGSFTGFDETSPRGLPAALALLAFLSNGHTPTEGRYALTVHNVIDYLVRYFPEDEDFGRSDGSGTRGQALITIALSQACGTDHDRNQRQQIRAMLGRALTAIVKAQDPQTGGWAMDGRGPPQLQATALMVLALRSLDDAGIPAPPSTTTRAADFARSCLAKDRRGFVERGAGQPTPLSTSAGVIVLLSSGAAKPADWTEALGASAKKGFDPNAPDALTSIYLGAVAARLCGGAGFGAAWNPLRDVFQSKLKQSEDGSWLPPHAPPIGTGAVEATSLAVMTLTMPNRVLPLYGR